MPSLSPSENLDQENRTYIPFLHYSLRLTGHLVNPFHGRQIRPDSSSWFLQGTRKEKHKKKQKIRQKSGKLFPGLGLRGWSPLAPQ
ncbi:hypothetical protein CBFG_05126 [Clostridiales bacterium 1_7_47FAA]|nr:hypothetical protein CBFG_05126 [Clostridiales bacterium 1_7_47FAA]